MVKEKPIMGLFGDLKIIYNNLKLKNYVDY